MRSASKTAIGGESGFSSLRDRLLPTRRIRGIVGCQRQASVLGSGSCTVASGRGAVGRNTVCYA